MTSGPAPSGTAWPRPGRAKRTCNPPSPRPLPLPTKSWQRPSSSSNGRRYGGLATCLLLPAWSGRSRVAHDVWDCMEYGLKPLGREKFWLLALLAPTLIGLAFGAFGSVLATLALSFTKWDLLTPPAWAGVANYVSLVTDERVLVSLTNTLKFSALYVPGVVIVSLLVAVLMNR